MFRHARTSENASFPKLVNTPPSNIHLGGSYRFRWKGMHMPMKDASIGMIKEIAAKKGLKPGRVRGTEEVQITKGNNPRVEIIDWIEFETILAKRGLTVRESGGFMKIMRK